MPATLGGHFSPEPGLLLGVMGDMRVAAIGAVRCHASCSVMLPKASASPSSTTAAATLLSSLDLVALAFWKSAAIVRSPGIPTPAAMRWTRKDGLKLRFEF